MDDQDTVTLTRADVGRLAELVQQVVDANKRYARSCMFAGFLAGVSMTFAVVALWVYVEVF